MKKKSGNKIGKASNFLLLTSYILFLTSYTFGQTLDVNKHLKIYEFSIKETIAPPVWHKTRKAFREAKQMKADLIMINMNTYGGMLESADSMRTIILQSKIPVYVFINNNAASAGALIAISCNKIFMRKGANIGAATVVNEKGEKLPDKYQSYMRSMMRSTAETRGRDPEIAEAMVGAIRKVGAIADSGRVLTFTTTEALKNHYCDGEAETISDVLSSQGIKNYEITEQKLTPLDWIIGLLVNPVVGGILIMVIVAGIYFEFQSPGAVFPIITAAAAAVLYFAPMYLEGFANNWEIVLFIAGVIFVALEIFVFPGHGIALITGIVMVITGLTLTMIHNLGFNFHLLPSHAIVYAFAIVVIAMFASLIGSFLLSKQLFAGAIFGKRLALDAVQEKEEGFTSAISKMTEMIGKTGTAHTILRPVGNVEIEGNYYPATAETGFINKDERIKVVRYENSQLIVRKIN